MSIGAFNIEPNDLFHLAKLLEEKGCAYQYFEDASFNGRTVKVRNKEYIHFASCSYLGLETHPALIEASVDAVKRYGTQTPSSRAMLSSPLYREFEDHLKVMFPGHAVVTQTVTLAHCSVLPLLLDERDAIILDGYAHNSLRMASQLCKTSGTFTMLSLHNNMENVEYFIKRLRKEGYRNIWYCADGVYSIHGNFCDIRGLHRLLDTYDNFYAYVDDAHGTGWCGKYGSGYVLGAFALHPKMIVAESFAKSMVSSGGCVVVPDPTLAEYIRYAGQTMIFSGPIQPAILGSMIACIKMHETSEIVSYQQELELKIQYFRKKSAELDLPIVTKDITPIQLLRIGGMQKTLDVLDGLVANGFFPFTAMYPAIAKGDEGIRITLTRHLTNEDIDRFLNTLHTLI